MLEGCMPLRLMTYNIRHGRGLDGRVDLPRIADVILARDPDVVTLQEVDYGRFRSGEVDQTERLAALLGMEARFAPCITHDDGHYGIATLSRLPVRASRQIELPRGKSARFSEPRSALLTRVGWGRDELDLVNTHLSLRADERAPQALVLAALGDADELVVAGDLNCTPSSAAYRSLLTRLRGVPVRRASWPSRWPFLQLDHVLYRGALLHSAAEVVADPLARRASDHLPVVASFDPDHHGRRHRRGAHRPSGDQS
jgi:endonuclease/exonuclease/phosphatase family metal-dependent hydrolase